MNNSKIRDRGFYEELVGTMPAVVDNMNYILLVMDDEGKAVVVSNVPPKGQQYCLALACKAFEDKEPEFFPGKDKH